MFAWPVNVQQRLITYLLNKSLGSYFHLEHGQEWAQFRNGSLELTDLRLNVDTLNKTALPLNARIISGSMARLSIQLSSPVSWSSTLQIDVQDVVLECEVSLDAENDSQSPEDLEDIVQSMAASILHDPTASTLLMEDDVDSIPGGFDVRRSVEDSQEVVDQSLMASMIEKLLARLSLTVSSLQCVMRIRTAVPSQSSGLRICLTQMSITPEDDRARHFNLDGASCSLASTQVSSAVPRSSTSSDTSSDSTDSQNDLFMSMAIADLRHSTSENAVSQQLESVYQSVLPSEPQRLTWHPPILTLSRTNETPALQLQIKLLPVGLKIQALKGRIYCCHLDIWPDYLPMIQLVAQPFLRGTNASVPPPAKHSATSKNLSLDLQLTDLTLMTCYDVYASPIVSTSDIPSSLTLNIKNTVLNHHASSTHLSIHALSLYEISSSHQKSDVISAVIPIQCPDTNYFAPYSTEISSTVVSPFLVLDIGLTTTARIQPFRLDFDLGLLERVKTLQNSMSSFFLPVSSSEGKNTSGSGSRIEIACDFLHFSIRCPTTKRQPSELSGFVWGANGRKEGQHAHLRTLVIAAAYQMKGAHQKQFLHVRPLVTEAIVSTGAEDVSQCKLNIQSVFLDLNKYVIDGLQYLADDITCFLTNSSSTASSPRTDKSMRELLETSYASRSSSGFSLDKSQNAHVKGKIVDASLAIDKVHCAVHLTESANQELTAVAQHTTLELSARNTSGKSESIVTLSVLHLDLEDLLTNLPFIHSDSKRSSSALKIQYISTDRASRLKTTKASVDLDGLSFYLPMEIKPLTDLIQTIKSPKDVFETAVPADKTSVVLRASRLDLKAAQERLSLRLNSYHSQWELRRKGCQSSMKFSELSLWQRSEEASALLTTDTECYTRLVSIREPVIDAFFPAKSLSLQTSTFTTSKPHVEIEVCRDSLQTLARDVALALHCLKDENAAQLQAPPRARLPAVRVELDNSVDLLSSIDQSAFNKTSQPALASSSPIDLFNDDIPQAQFLENNTLNATDGIVQMLAPSGLQITSNYLSAYTYDVRRPEYNVSANANDRSKYSLDQAALIVRLFAGYDWPESRRQILKGLKERRKRLQKFKALLTDDEKQMNPLDQQQLAKEEDKLQRLILQIEQSIASDAEVSASDETMSHETDCLFADWENIPAFHSVKLPQLSEPAIDMQRKTLKRSKTAMMEIQLHQINGLIRLFDAQKEQVILAEVGAGTFAIIDRLPTSTWRKFLTEMRSHDGGFSRPGDQPMLRVQATYRPNDLQLKVKLHPIRLYVDQDAVDFLKAFFVPLHDKETDANQEDDLFISKLEIYPIKLRLDYKPKHVNYSLLPSSSLELMNFFHFASSDITLRHITLSGIRSSAVSNMLQDIWTPDVKANQLADVLAGINPLRSVVQIGGGIADLVLLPVEQYKKDGRIIRGIQKGTDSFSRRTALETVKLGAKLANGTQIILERAEKVLGATVASDVVGTVRADEEAESRSPRAVQPNNATDGVKQAYTSLATNLKSAAQTILAVPMEVYETNSHGTTQKVLRAIPVAVLQPAIGATQAIQKTLQGVANTIDKASVDRRSDKYK